MKNVRNFLNENKFKYANEFDGFLDKSKKMYSIYEEKSKFISNFDISSPNDIEQILNSAINKNEKIDIVYNDISGEQHKRTIHPLYMFKYKDNCYVTAYCELRQDIRHFEIKRIVSVK